MLTVVCFAFLSSAPVFVLQESSKRKVFLQKIEQLMMKLVPTAPVDAACDQMAKRVLTENLPPVLTEGKAIDGICTEYGNSWDMNAFNTCIVLE